MTAFFQALKRVAIGIVILCCLLGALIVPLAQPTPAPSGLKYAAVDPAWTPGCPEWTAEWRAFSHVSTRAAPLRSWLHFSQLQGQLILLEPRFGQALVVWEGDTPRVLPMPPQMLLRGIIDTPGAPWFLLHNRNTNSAVLAEMDPVTWQPRQTIPVPAPDTSTATQVGESEYSTPCTFPDGSAAIRAVTQTAVGPLSVKGLSLAHYLFDPRAATLEPRPPSMYYDGGAIIALDNHRFATLQDRRLWPSAGLGLTHLVDWDSGTVDHKPTSASQHGVLLALPPYPPPPAVLPPPGWVPWEPELSTVGPAPVRIAQEIYRYSPGHVAAGSPFIARVRADLESRGIYLQRQHRFRILRGDGALVSNTGVAPLPDEFIDSAAWTARETKQNQLTQLYALDQTHALLVQPVFPAPNLDQSQGERGLIRLGLIDSTALTLTWLGYVSHPPLDLYETPREVRVFDSLSGWQVGMSSGSGHPFRWTTIPYPSAWPYARPAGQLTPFAPAIAAAP